MDADLKRRWVEELRSGEYAQGRMRLRTADDKYCCLGVLCDLVDPDGWTDSGAFQYGPSLDRSVLPESMQEALGLIDRSGSPMDVVVGMNDSNKSFAEIADWIEENIPAEPSA